MDAATTQEGTRIPAGSVRTAAALAGLTYTIDVLRLIPYANLELGVIRFGGAVTKAETVFAAELGIGADYFLSRRWTTGVSFQYLFAPADLISRPPQPRKLAVLVLGDVAGVAAVLILRALSPGGICGRGSVPSPAWGVGPGASSCGRGRRGARASLRSRTPCAAG